MSLAGHLRIDLAEYDDRIRTFIPDYDEMLQAGAAAVPRNARTIVDLGVGTGAFAARCLRRASRARVAGIDTDGDVLQVAARRLHNRGTFIRGSFVRAPLPHADAVIASFALHHVRTRSAKRRLYERIRAAMGPRGTFVTVDCQPSSDRGAARAEFDAWIAHLCRSYSRREAAAFLKSWSAEDVYVPLPAEVGLMERAGFDVDVVWRRGAFAVLRSRPRS
jgi:ubiquinone/menaquinone biosynthesis C-methylase UbiE